MCGSASTIEEEVVWRLLQGIFGAPMLPLSQAIAVDSFPPERHGAATAIWTFELPDLPPGPHLVEVLATDEAGVTRSDVALVTTP